MNIVLIDLRIWENQFWYLFQLSMVETSKAVHIWRHMYNLFWNTRMTSSWVTYYNYPSLSTHHTFPNHPRCNILITSLWRDDYHVPELYWLWFLLTITNWTCTSPLIPFYIAFLPFIFIWYFWNWADHDSWILFYYVWQILHSVRRQ